MPIALFRRLRGENRQPEGPLFSSAACEKASGLCAQAHSIPLESTMAVAGNNILKNLLQA
jgi:hypothetical protein